jgi:stage IV sporulation protein FB
VLRFTLFKFPVHVHWLFWILCFFLGGGLRTQTRDDMVDVLIFCTVAFAAMLIHELGHAVAARRFGAHPWIVLHGLGGVTFLGQRGFSRRQQILISLSGPGAGLVSAALVYLFFHALRGSFSRMTVEWVVLFLEVSVFWSVANMLPILPLDGGQVLRDILGPSRIRLACWIGMITALLAALAALILQGSLWNTALLGFLAYANFKGTRMMGGVHRDETVHGPER